MRKLILLTCLIGTASAGSFYVGVDGGLASQSFAYNNSVLGPQLNNSQLNVSGTGYDAQLGIFGGYDFSKYWGMELGYQYLFNSNNITGAGYGPDNYPTSYNLNSQLVDLLAVGSLPIEDSNFAIYAKLGLAYVFPQMGQFCAGGACLASPPSGSGLTLAAGLGLKYAITRRWDTHIEVMNYGSLIPVNLTSNGNNYGTWSSTSLLVGGSWHF